MTTPSTPALVRAPEWPAPETPDVKDAARLRKLAYTRVVRAPGTEEQERVSGAFRVLPVELVDVICAKLLRIGFEHFCSFVRTCRAAFRVVSKRTAIETMCMRHLFNRAFLGDRVAMTDEAEQYPFTEFAKTMIRSRMEQEALHECTEGSVLHCADPTSECCRTQRAELNARWRQHPTIAERFPKDTLGAEALRGRRACNVSVAASAGSELLCATADGAVLASADRVWTVTSKPAAEFTPGYELATTVLMERPSADEIIWAAAEGNRIALCQRTHDTQVESFYVVKIFDDGRLVDEADVSDPCLHCPPGRGGYARHAPSFMERMWMHKGEVWFAFLHEYVANETFSWVRIHAIQPAVRANRSTRWRDSHSLVHSFGRVDCTSVAADSGDLALLETHPSEVRIWTFDMKTRKYALVPADPRYGHPKPHMNEGEAFLHQIRLSPDGLVMVLLDRSRVSVYGQRGCILLYRRCAYGDTSGAMKWRVLWTGGGSVIRPVSSVMRWSPLMEAVFTPCGRRFYVFFLATDRSPGGMLRMDTTFGTEVNDVFSNIPPYRLPSKMVWSKDGLFVQTATTPTGVLRLGLVA